MSLSVNKLKKVIMRRVARTSAVFDMFPERGKAVIGLSGGADSMVLVDILYELSRKWRKQIEFFPVMVHPGFFPLDEGKIARIEDFCRSRGMELTVINADFIARRVESPQHRFPPCFTCSRLRRKTLLEFAHERGISLVVLGHHKDDLLETFFLNILFSRRISAILPKQELFRGLFHILRPMILVDEDYIKRYANLRAFPIIEKNCPYAGNTEREWVKNLLAQMERERPGIKKNILRALFHPKPEYLWGQFEHLMNKLIE